MGFQLSTKQKWLLAGAAAIVVLVVILRSRSSSSGGATAAMPAMAAPTVADSTGGAAPISTGQLAAFESQLTASQDSFLQQLQQAFSPASGTTAPTSPAPPVTTTSGAPAPSPTPAPAPPPPAVTPVGPPAGSVSVGGQTLDYISSEQAGSALAANGDTIDAVIAGRAVPVVVKGKRTAAWSTLPKGTRLYDAGKA